MFVINEKNYIIIPIDYNAFFYSAKENPKKIRYSKDYVISDNLFKEIFECINSNQNKVIILDMRNIVFYNPRMFGDLEPYIDKIVFVNVGNVGSVKQRLVEDLEGLEWEGESIGFGTGLKVFMMSSNICELINSYRKDKIIEIIFDLVENENKPILLESSGLYGNYYVNIKKMFLNVDNFYFIMFCLAEMVYPYIISKRINAFVSSSKNGAIIANILGGLLDVKEVHLIGVGPKYSMELCDSVKCIQEERKYAYIFDFMCTGTELKIVIALINSKRGYLVYSAGIARYKENINFNLIKDMDVIVDTKELGIKYKIFGEPGDFEIEKEVVK